MPAGTITYPNRIATGPFLADPAVADNYVPGPVALDPNAFPAVDAVTVTIGTGGAASGAVSVPVAALSGPLPSGTALYLGNQKYALLTAPALAGAVLLAVQPLPTTLVAGDVGTYLGVGVLVVSAGTYIGRTQAEADAKSPFHPALANSDQRYLLAYDVNLRQLTTGTVIRHGRAIKENFLPGWAQISLAAPLLALLRADYTCIVGNR